MTEMNAPKKDSLPTRRNRFRLGGATYKEISVSLRTITPILGAGTIARMLDKVDIIRVPTIRGHLRFWWRALFGHRYGNDFQQLYRWEKELWGGADKDGAVRSSVEIFIDTCRPLTPAEIDITEPSMRDISSYALWPARSQTGENIPAAHRIKPGYTFNLRLSFSQLDNNTEEEIRNVLRAWILFGGYGSRTRRGVGSITVQENNRKEWLPTAATREAIISLFNGVDVLAPVHGVVSSDMPSIQAGSLIFGKTSENPLNAWETALGWLREFRQGYRDKPGDRAREPIAKGKNHPSISNWPEADKIRHWSCKNRINTCSSHPPCIWTHTPRYGKEPAWPRSSFGLPIIGKFSSGTEPDPFELRWSPNVPNGDNDNSIGSRLASPLIVKALPLTDDRFVPCALWLNRAYPDGSVVLGRNTGGTYASVPGSEAPFDKIAGATDTLLFNPLVGKTTIREAFLTWLAGKPGCTQVAP